jgi:hypothetical protein
MGCRAAQPDELHQLLGEMPDTLDFGLLTRPYPRPQLLALLQNFVGQGETSLTKPHPLDSQAGTKN